MMTETILWNIAGAKSKFSELIGIAIKEPQVIYNRKEPKIVMLSYSEFKRLSELDVLVHKKPAWSDFTKFSSELTKKKSFELELPSRNDRRNQNI
ncbi:MAG: type II toxin-antitoxin system Phd/YefM family antitoxin [Leptospiraceae bacterium]|nr:type II toxin-antitoxin system Phd/YefM family antitoxin [Leptospiraceae bacterium]